MILLSGCRISTYISIKSDQFRGMKEEENRGRGPSGSPVHLRPTTGRRRYNFDPGKSGSDLNGLIPASPIHHDYFRLYPGKDLINPRESPTNGFLFIQDWNNNTNFRVIHNSNREHSSFLILKYFSLSRESEKLVKRVFAS